MTKIAAMPIYVKNPSKIFLGELTGLVVRAMDSGSGDPGLILGRVGVLFPCPRDIYSPKVLVIPRNRWLRLNMTEKLFTGMLNKNQKKFFFHRNRQVDFHKTGYVESGTPAHYNLLKMMTLK